MIGKSSRKSHKQTFNMVLKLSARICCTAGIEHRQRPAVEKAHNRSKAIALVMGVVRLSFLITVKINMRGVDINDQYRSLPGPGPGKDAMLSVGPMAFLIYWHGASQTLGRGFLKDWDRSLNF